MQEVKFRTKKRNKYEIIYDILSICENGARKTWVIYRANLSYGLTNEYMKKLMDAGLIEWKDSIYYLTEKGKKLLELLKDYKEKKQSLEKITVQIKEIYGN